MRKEGFIIVFITASSKNEAEKIANALVGERLAACVNILPNLKSIYTWKGKRETSKEVLLIAKSKKEKFKRIVDKVKSLHSYEVPEIVCIPIIDGNKDYLKWIKETAICKRAK